MIAALGAVALAVSRLVRRFLPEIMVFLALGIAIGPEGLRLINEGNLGALQLITVVALGLIIFLLGDRLRLDALRGHLWQLLPVTLVQTLATGVLVFSAATLVGADVRLAFVLGVIAAETGVLTVTATVREERAGGRFTETLLAGVGVTNVIVAAAFGIAFPFVLAAGPDAGGGDAVVRAFSTIVIASTVIGIVAGWVLIRAGAAIETSGELLLFVVLVVIGIAAADLAVGGSVVVSTLLAGVFVANRAPWLADRMFAAVRTLEAPIYLVFFVVAGAGIHLEEVGTVGAIGGAYIVARVIGKTAGTIVGGRLARPVIPTRRAARLGLGMLPHAGMAIALVAFVVEQAPGLAEEVSSVVLGSIVVFELTGPLVLRRALRSSGEARRSETRAADSDEVHLADARTFRRVVIPVGNLVVALPRLPFLFDLVGSLAAELIVVHVTRPGAARDGEPEILRLVQRLARERNLECTTRHRVSESVAAAIAATVREEEADLLVMGEPVRMSVFESGGWSRTTQRVARLVSVPMLVYPVDPRDPTAVPTSYRRLAERAQSRDTAD